MGFRASERNLERLAALLLFAELDFKVEEQTEPTGPLPFDVDEPAQPAPQLEIDYEVVRRSVGRLMLAYVDRSPPGPEKVKAMLAEYGATGLSSLPQDKLLAFHDELEARLK